MSKAKWLELEPGDNKIRIFPVADTEWIKSHLQSIPEQPIKHDVVMLDYTDVRVVRDDGKPGVMRLTNRTLHKIMWEMSRQKYYGLYDTFRDRVLQACVNVER